MYFLCQGPKLTFTLYSLHSTQLYFALRVPCEPETLLIGALGGLVYFMSICVDSPVKIGVEAYSNQQ